MLWKGWNAAGVSSFIKIENNLNHEHKNRYFENSNHDTVRNQKNLLIYKFDLQFESKSQVIIFI